MGHGFHFAMWNNQRVGPPVQGICYLLFYSSSIIIYQLYITISNYIPLHTHIYIHIIIYIYMYIYIYTFIYTYIYIYIYLYIHIHTHIPILFDAQNNPKIRMISPSRIVTWRSAGAVTSWALRCSCCLRWSSSGNQRRRDLHGFRGWKPLVNIEKNMERSTISDR